MKLLDILKEIKVQPKVTPKIVKKLLKKLYQNYDIEEIQDIFAEIIPEEIYQFGLEDGSGYTFDEMLYKIDNNTLQILYLKLLKLN